MLKKFLLATTLSSILIWYVHEYHKSEVIQFSRNFPYMTGMITKFHLYLSSEIINPKDISEEKLYTPEDLEKYNGRRGSSGIYISILGHVFDVKKGKKHYGEGGTYNIFAGKDASRSFITGDFKVSTDDVLDLSPSEIISLRDWLKFYHQEYVYKGKLVGRYYDNLGEKTPYTLQLEEIIQLAEKEQISKQTDELEFPPCNIEWDADLGTRVWCSKRSGGIERDWVGVPRKLFKIGSDTFRCACVNLEELTNPQSTQYARRNLLQKYENCGPNDSSCFVDEQI